MVHVASSEALLKHAADRVAKTKPLDKLEMK